MWLQTALAQHPHTPPDGGITKVVHEIDEFHDMAPKAGATSSRIKCDRETLGSFVGSRLIRIRI